MNTTLLSTDTCEAIEQAYKFAKEHGKLIAICDTLDNHIEVMKAELTNDRYNVIGSELDHILTYSDMIRKSTELDECFELNDKMFNIHEFLNGLDQSWHFGTSCKRLLTELETILMNMYEIVEPFGEVNDINPCNQ